MEKDILVLYKAKTINLIELEGKEIEEVCEIMMKNINIKKLEEKIHDLILDLSGVAPPSFGADACYIALDNQKRLEISHQLLLYCDSVKSYFKYLKKNRKQSDLEQKYDFLVYLQKLAENILEYGKYKEDDIKTQIQQIEDGKKQQKLLYDLDLRISVNKRSD